MAPEWARASRPLVLVFVAIAFTVTLLFHANVDAQGGAYATGVLVLITSASCAVTIAAQKSLSRLILGFLSLIFIYTTLINIWERPEGLKISCIFIFTIIFMSLVSRAVRSTELRITGVELDDQAKTLIGDARNHIVRIIAWNSVWRQLVFPVVLPQEEMLPENFVCFGPKFDVDRDEIVSSVSTFLQDTYRGW